MSDFRIFLAAHFITIGWARKFTPAAVSDLIIFSLVDLRSSEFSRPLKNGHKQF